MKTILGSRKHYYLKIVGIFLIVVAMVAGIVGCAGGPTPPKDDLTTAVNPASANYEEFTYARSGESVFPSCNARLPTYLCTI